jgi:hypothetical protein
LIWEECGRFLALHRLLGKLFSNDPFLGREPPFGGWPRPKSRASVTPTSRSSRSQLGHILTAVSESTRELSGPGNLRHERVLWKTGLTQRQETMRS